MSSVSRLMFQQQMKYWKERRRRIANATSSPKGFKSKPWDKASEVEDETRVEGARRREVDEKEGRVNGFVKASNKPLPFLPTQLSECNIVLDKIDDAALHAKLAGKLVDKVSSGREVQSKGAHRGRQVEEEENIFKETISIYISPEVQSPYFMSHTPFFLHYSLHSSHAVISIITTSFSPIYPTALPRGFKSC